MAAILYSSSGSLFFDFNEGVISFPMDTLEESFFITTPGKISPGLLDCNGLCFSETQLHTTQFHALSGNFVQQLLPKAAELFQTSPIFYDLCNAISYGGLLLTLCRLMQVMDSIPVTKALCFLCHLPSKFELRLSLFHSIQRNRKLLP